MLTFLRSPQHIMHGVNLDERLNFSSTEFILVFFFPKETVLSSMTKGLC